MAESPIVFDRVAKKFRRGERHTSLRDLVPAVIGGIMGRRAGSTDDRDFWALRNVSFEVKAGEGFGIIGSNGAGKSTSLKLLTRIMKPTHGYCRATGRVGALIEVTAGFHPDLTGRENVFFQGAIMGMKRAEIQRRFDAIVDFAGLGQFIDTPVKRYSSGMSARLGFSIAAHLSPDVLIIDEVLAVGDLAFQAQCYERMAQFKREGTAIVLVSHNFAAISQVCDRVGLLRAGEMQLFDAVADGISSYSSTSLRANSDRPDAQQVLVLDNCGQVVNRAKFGQVLDIVGQLMPPPHEEASLSAYLRVLRLETNELVYTTSSESLGTEPLAISNEPIHVRWRVHAYMARGHYSIEVQVYETVRKQVLLTVAAPMLAIEEDETEWGSVCLAATCTLQSGKEAITLAG